MAQGANVQGVQHLGMVVPDADAASRFFARGLGAVELFRAGPFVVDEERARRYDVDPGSTLTNLVMLRCGRGANIELLEFDSYHSSDGPRRNDQVGGGHLAFQVTSLPEASEALQLAGAEACGTPSEVQVGPLAGLRWQYFKSPWGAYVELVEIGDDGLGFEREGRDRLFRP